jgi:restriction system protein
MEMTNDPSPLVPKYNELMFPCLKALKALGGSATNEEILDKVCEIERIPEVAQRVRYRDGRYNMLTHRLAWAKSFLKAVGALNNSERGVWATTEKGMSLTAEDCKKIPAEVQKALRALAMGNALEISGKPIRT